MQVESTPLDEVFAEIDKEFRRKRQGPLSDDEKAQLRRELEVIPEFVRETSVRGVKKTWKSLYRDEEVEERAADIRKRRRTRFTELGVDVGSLASKLYRAAIASRVILSGIRWEPRATVGRVAELLNDPVWTVQEVTPEVLRQQRRLWERSLDLQPERNLTDIEQYVTWQVGDRLYDPELRKAGDPSGEEIERLATVRPVEADWRRQIRDHVAHSPLVGEWSSNILKFLRETIEKQAQTVASTLGPGSRAAREAADRFDLSQGRTTPNCLQWTYEELEMWSRNALSGLSTQQVYDWLTRHAANFDLEVRGDPTQADPTSFAEAAHVLIRVASKRVLCELINLAGVSAAVIGGEPFTYHNLSLGRAYFPSATVSQLSRELGEISSRAESLCWPTRGDECPVVRSTESRIVYNIGQNNDRVPSPLTRSVMDALLPVLTPGIVFGMVTASRLRIPADAVATLDLADRSWPQLVVVVSGRLLVSAVTTGQRRILQREGIVYQEIEQPLLDPVRILVEVGDFLFIREHVPSTHDYLVLHPHEGPAEVLLFDLQNMQFR